MQQACWKTENRIQNGTFISLCSAKKTSRKLLLYRFRLNSKTREDLKEKPSFALHTELKGLFSTSDAKEK